MVRRAAAGRTRANTVRQVVAVLVVAALVVQVGRIDSPERIMFFAGTTAVLAALLAADVAAVVLARLDRGHHAPARRLAIRQLAGDGRRLGVAVATLAVVLGLPVAFLCLVATMTATSKDAAVPDVRPGQVAVSGVGGQLTPASAAVSRLTRARLEQAHQPVRLRYLGTEELPLAAGAGGYGFLALFDTPSDVASFFPGGLSTASRATLQRGGVLSWDGAGTTRRLRWKPGLPAVSVASREIERPRVAWGVSTVAVGLTGSAGRWGLPSAPGAVFYNRVSPREVRDVRAALVAHGLDADQLTSYRAPRPPLAPIAYVLVIGLLLVLAFAASYSVMRLQGDALRRHLAMTSALGMPAAWCRRVLLIQFALILGVGTVLAVVVGVLPVVVGAWKLDGFVLDIPLLQLLGLAVAIYVVSSAALVMAGRQIRPARIAV